MSPAGLARFWACAIWFTVRQAWAALPGPWPVKLALIIACQLIPGPLDELALLAIVAAWRRYRARGRRAVGHDSRGAPPGHHGQGGRPGPI